MGQAASDACNESGFSPMKLPMPYTATGPPPPPAGPPIPLSGLPSSASLFRNIVPLCWSVNGIRLYKGEDGFVRISGSWTRKSGEWEIGHMTGRLGILPEEYRPIVDCGIECGHQSGHVIGSSILIRSNGRIKYNLVTTAACDPDFSICGVYPTADVGGVLSSQHVHWNRDFGEKRGGFTLYKCSDGFVRFAGCLDHGESAIHEGSSSEIVGSLPSDVHPVNQVGFECGSSNPAIIKASMLFLLNGTVKIAVIAREASNAQLFVCGLYRWKLRSEVIESFSSVSLKQPYQETKEGFVFARCSDGFVRFEGSFELGGEVEFREGHLCERIGWLERQFAPLEWTSVSLSHGNPSVQQASLALYPNGEIYVNAISGERVNPEFSVVGVFRQLDHVDT